MMGATSAASCTGVKDLNVDLFGSQITTARSF